MRLKRWIELAVRRAADADMRIFLLEEGDEPPMEPSASDVVLLAKADLNDNIAGGISGVTGEGVEELLERLEGELSLRAAGAGLATHARHAVAMTRAREGIVEALNLLDAGPDCYDLVSAELRMAVHAFEVLVGRIDTENLLDEIFASFCLGK